MATLGFRHGLSHVHQERAGSPRSGSHLKAKKSEVTRERASMNTPELRACGALWYLLVNSKVEDKPRY